MEGQMDEPMEREKQGWKYKSKDGKTKARKERRLVNKWSDVRDRDRSSNIRK